MDMVGLPVGTDTGLACNSWAARPWVYEGYLFPSIGRRFIALNNGIATTLNAEGVQPPASCTISARAAQTPAMSTTCGAKAL